MKTEEEKLIEEWAAAKENVEKTNKLIGKSKEWVLAKVKELVFSERTVKGDVPKIVQVSLVELVDYVEGFKGDVKDSIILALAEGYEWGYKGVSIKGPSSFTDAKGVEYGADETDLTLGKVSIAKVRNVSLRDAGSIYKDSNILSFKNGRLVTPQLTETGEFKACWRGESGYMFWKIEPVENKRTDGKRDSWLVKEAFGNERTPELNIPGLKEGHQLGVRVWHLGGIKPDEEVIKALKYASFENLTLLNNVTAERVYGVLKKAGEVLKS